MVESIICNLSEKYGYFLTKTVINYNLSDLMGVFLTKIVTDSSSLRSSE